MSTREREALVARLRTNPDDKFLADLEGADLEGANLEGVSLQLANLEEANLQEANLQLADLERVRLEEADLRGANLTGADLQEADLEGAHLMGADLAGANLIQADLSRADLSKADLEGAHLIGASLQRANLQRATLRWADLTGADLTRADFTEANLQEANLRQAVMINMKLNAGMFDANLEGAHIGWRAVARSLQVEGLQILLVRTGMPEVAAIYLIESLRSIDEMDLFTMLQTVFLSYGGPDAEFAERFRSDLTRNGVKTWFFPRDAVPGARIHQHLQANINTYDRLILCCSETSLQRLGVLREIEEVLAREGREGGTNVLIPILLDSIFDTRAEPPSWWPDGKRHIYLTLFDRVAADFRGAMDDPGQWSQQLSRVLAALRKKPDR